jgi:glycosyltransferase involved in cell wall biosynthesis
MGKVMKMSIAIPTYECKGRGNEFLEDLFRTIQIQTFKDFEVVVSDHSVDNEILKLIDEYRKKFKIVYVKNEDNRGNGPANTNNAIKNCSGEIIKIMFQDDFFYDDEALEKIYNAFDSDTNWVLCGSNHTKNDGNSFYWDLFPTWNDDILNGVNTISSPSVLATRRIVFNNVKFDTNLVMMMDCELYYHIKKLYGYPVYCHDILVSNRIHEDQISSMYLKNNYQKKFDDELQYCKEKHEVK